MVTMVNHLAGHAAVYTDVFARYEARMIGTQEQHHVGDIHGIADAACGLLHGIGTFIDRTGRVYPAWRDGVDPYATREADSQGMGQCSDASLGGRITFGLRLAHAVA